jgi:hypothetical protein
MGPGVAKEAIAAGTGGKWFPGKQPVPEGPTSLDLSNMYIVHLFPRKFWRYQMALREGYHDLNKETEMKLQFIQTRRRAHRSRFR